MHLLNTKDFAGDSPSGHIRHPGAFFTRSTRFFRVLRVNFDRYFRDRRKPDGNAEPPTGLRHGGRMLRDSRRRAGSSNLRTGPYAGGFGRHSRSWLNRSADRRGRLKQVVLNPYNPLVFELGKALWEQQVRGLRLLEKPDLTKISF